MPGVNHSTQADTHHAGPKYGRRWSVVNRDEMDMRRLLELSEAEVKVADNLVHSSSANLLLTDDTRSVGSARSGAGRRLSTTIPNIPRTPVTEVWFAPVVQSWAVTCSYRCCGCGLVLLLLWLALLWC